MFDKIKVNKRLREVKKLEEEVRKLKGQASPKEMPDRIQGKVKDDIKRLDVNVKGKYITKDLKLSWIAVLIIAILIIVGLTIFSQWKFKSINSEFDAKVAELQKTYETLKEKEGKLNETAKELVLKNARETSLADQYDQVKKERDGYKSQKEELEQKNSDLEVELDNANKQIQTLKDEIAALKKKLSS